MHTSSTPYSNRIPTNWTDEYHHPPLHIHTHKETNGVVEREQKARTILPHRWRLYRASHILPSSSSAMSPTASHRMLPSTNDTVQTKPFPIRGELTSIITYEYIGSNAMSSAIASFSVHFSFTYGHWIIIAMWKLAWQLAVFIVHLIRSRAPKKNNSRCGCTFWLHWKVHPIVTPSKKQSCWWYLIDR